jgi:predicted RecB family endonuclease
MWAGRTRQDLRAALMKALRQLGFFKLPFRQDEPEHEDGRVLALFRNRAELKKAYGELQEEIYRLKDRIKQQEGATQRVQEMLNALELRLGIPDSAYPALVFYQLRKLWQAGREIIEQFVADLVRQQDERERKQHLAEHNRRQFSKRETAERQLRTAETIAAEAAGKVAQLEAEQARLTRFWHYFKRRGLDQPIASARSTVAIANSSLAEAREAAQAIEKEPIPEFPGLTVETRRAINVAAIAYAEVLCLRLVKTPLVRLAREATGRREVTDDYGSRPECEALMAEIDRARTLLQGRNSIAQEIKTRSDRLKQVARYRGTADTSPTSDSLAFSEGDVLDTDATGASAARMPNVLAEDTWDLFRILLR